MLIIRQLWAAVVVFIVWAETNGSQAPKITFINIAEIGLRLCEFFFFGYQHVHMHLVHLNHDKCFMHIRTVQVKTIHLFNLN